METLLEEVNLAKIDVHSLIDRDERNHLHPQHKKATTQLVPVV